MSNDLNLCQLIGRLGNDPEIRYMPDGKAVASFSIACGSQWKDKNTNEKKESTEWVSCAAFGRTAEVIGEYLRKGSQVYVAGRIKTEKYQKDGHDRYSTKIVVDRMQMLGGNGQRSEMSQERPQGVQTATAGSNFDDFDDDIPF